MILKGNQRGGGNQLAAHLMKMEDNEHVHIHELRGFVSDDLHSAFHEANAVSRGTHATHFLFSLSLYPPPNEIQNTIKGFPVNTAQHHHDNLVVEVDQASSGEV